MPKAKRKVKVYDAIDVDEAREMQAEIRQIALDYGLDPFTTVFEMIDFEEMNEVVSYGGFPNRYPHWRFGMEFETMRKSYAYGLHKIYELVINNDPCYAYLLRSNSAIEQKIVMAHVYGHSDFFKNNLWYGPTNRKMLDEMANHGARIKHYMDRYGVDTVEAALDTAMSLENLIDYHSMYTPKPRPRPSYYEDEETRPREVKRLKATKRYMEKFINPPEYIRKEKEKLETRRLEPKRFPESPERDVLLFITQHAPLSNWQRDVLSIVREEAYYLAPQHLTKIMNEGWAAYWHSKILTERCLRDEELIDYADINAGVLGGGAAINPYKLGLELFRDIEERWDARGENGREKIFEVRKVHSDVTFLDEFLNEDFCERHKFFLYRFNPQRGVYEIASREFPVVKRTMLFKLTNMGHPRIEVIDGNHGGRQELLLRHLHDGVDLEIEEAKDTIVSLCKVWQHPVHLWTQIEGQHRLLSYDGEEHKETNITEKGP